MKEYFKKIKEHILVFLKDPLFLRRWDEPDHYRFRRQDNSNKLSFRTSLNRRGRHHYHGTSSMFIEDLFTGIMPFMIYRESVAKYVARIEPASTEKENLIAGALSERRHHGTLAEGLCDFVRETAQILLLDGVVIYEIICNRNESDEIESFEFEHIDPFNLYKIFGNYYQFISWGEAQASRTKVRIIKIPKEKVLRIDFPKQLGGKRKLNTILRRSWKLGQDIIPEFQKDAMNKQENIGFDMASYSNATYLEIAALTKDIGWNQRSRSTNHITEYYALLRLLKQKKAEALIREVIFDKLNETLNKPYLNLGSRVSMTNLFSVTDIEEKIRTIEQGNVTFADLFTDTSF